MLWVDLLYDNNLILTRYWHFVSLCHRLRITISHSHWSTKVDARPPLYHTRRLSMNAQRRIGGSMELLSLLMISCWLMMLCVIFSFCHTLFPGRICYLLVKSWIILIIMSYAVINASTSCHSRIFISRLHFLCHFTRRRWEGRHFIALPAMGSGSRVSW